MKVMHVIIEKRYVEIRHTHPIKEVGFIYPKAGVTAKVQEGLQVSEGGNELRIHTNGDTFAYDGNGWKRVYDIDTVIYIPKKF